MFGSCKIFSRNAIFGKGKYFQVFFCIMKIFVENIFMYLVLFWKCYFPTNFSHFLSYFLNIQTNFITENFKITAKSQSTEQITAKYPSLATTNNNPQPPKFIPTIETTLHTPETPIQPMAANFDNQKPQSTVSKQNPPPHNKKTTKTPPPTPLQQQQKSKSHKNQNRTEREISSWVSGEVEGSGLLVKSKARGLKALGRRSVGRRLWLWVCRRSQRLVRGFVAWSLWVVGEVEGSWVTGDGLSLLPLSFSFCARARSHSHSLTLSLSLSLSLSLCFLENDIWR